MKLKWWVDAFLIDARVRDETPEPEPTLPSPEGSEVQEPPEVIIPGPLRTFVFAKDTSPVEKLQAELLHQCIISRDKRRAEVTAGRRGAQPRIQPTYSGPILSHANPPFSTSPTILAPHIKPDIEVEPVQENPMTILQEYWAKYYSDCPFWGASLGYSS